MNEAIKEARMGVLNKDGGPFGAIVLKDDKIVGYGHNCVLGHNDPTAHAEVMAIRDACKKLGTYDLTGCRIVTTSEPCPMCLSAIIWSNIKDVEFSTDRVEVASIGFRDNLIYEYLEHKSENILNIKKVDSPECDKLLEEYRNTIY